MINKNFFEAHELPEGDKVYLKKGILGWRVIEPVKNPETGKISWFNVFFGGKKGLFNIVALIIIASLFYAGINELVGNYKEVAEDPCRFCQNGSFSCAGQINSYAANLNKNKINWTELIIANQSDQGVDK